MPNYYVNKNAQPTGEHEVHQDGCPTPASPFNRQALGWFASCRPAVVEARKYYSNVDGCANCCPECHKR
jgi:hypothetical protein